MKNYIKGRTCNSCMWCNQCPSGKPCEFYYNPKADMELEMSREEQGERYDEYRAQWSRMEKEQELYEEW